MLDVRLDFSDGGSISKPCRLDAMETFQGVGDFNFRVHKRVEKDLACFIDYADLADSSLAIRLLHLTIQANEKTLTGGRRSIFTGTDCARI